MSFSFVVNANTTFRAWSHPASMERNNVEAFCVIFEEPDQPKPRASEFWRLCAACFVALSSRFQRAMRWQRFCPRALSVLLPPNMDIYIHISTCGVIADCRVCLQGARAVLVCSLLMLAAT